MAQVNILTMFQHVCILINRRNTPLKLDLYFLHVGKFNHITIVNRQDKTMSLLHLNLVLCYLVIFRFPYVSCDIEHAFICMKGGPVYLMKVIYDTFVPQRDNWIQVFAGMAGIMTCIVDSSCVITVPPSWLEQHWIVKLKEFDFITCNGKQPTLHIRFVFHTSVWQFVCLITACIIYFLEVTDLQWYAENNPMPNRISVTERHTDLIGSSRTLNSWKLHVAYLGLYMSFRRCTWLKLCNILDVNMYCIHINFQCS